MEDRRIWLTRPAQAEAGQGFNIAPQVVDGKVFLSTSGQLNGGIAYALDAKTGTVLWKFHETKDPVPAGGRRPLGTGGAWGTPVVENGLVYFGIANPYRSYNQATKTPNAVLYNDSTVALDENTGKLKWYYQGVPNDFYDWDMQIGPMYTASGPGGQPTVIDAGKMGIVYAMNATTGQARLEDAGRQAQRPRQRWPARTRGQAPPEVPVHGLPGHAWRRRDADGDGRRSHLRAGQQPLRTTSSPTNCRPTSQPAANPTTGTGDFEAINVDTGKVMWNTKLRRARMARRP